MRTRVEIVDLDSLWIAEYRKFVDALRIPSLYYTIEYRDFVSNLLGAETRYRLAIGDDRIVGVLPMMSKSGGFGTVVNSLPYYGSYGGVVALTAQAQAALWSDFESIVSQPEVAAATVVINPQLESTPPPIHHNLTDHRIGQITPIEYRHSPADEFMAAIDSTARRNIRKAQREGVEVYIDNQRLDFLFEIHVENMEQIGGSAKSHEFFQSIPEYFRPGIDYELYLARKDGEDIAALLLFYAGTTVEYFIPATRGRFRELQPMSLILYQAIVDAVAQGYTQWNWGGTWLSQTGVRRFKQKWGAVDHPYTYYIRIGNEAIYGAKAADLIREYRGFFVIPFDCLHPTEGGRDEG